MISKGIQHTMLPPSECFDECDARTKKYVLSWSKIVGASATNCPASTDEVVFVTSRLRNSIKYAVDTLSYGKSNVSSEVSDDAIAVFIACASLSNATQNKLKELVDQVVYASDDETLDERLASLHSYIKACLHNKAHDLIRRDRNADAVCLDAPGTVEGTTRADQIKVDYQPESPEDICIKKETVQKIRSFYGCLTDIERFVVEQHLEHGRSLAEIATAKGIPPGTARSHFCRARRKLQEQVLALYSA